MSKDIDLKEVEYPDNLKDKARESRIDTLIGKTYTEDGEQQVVDREKAEEMVDEDIFEPVQEFEGTIYQGLDNYLQQEFGNEQGKVQAPYNERKKVSKIRSKVIDAENGEFTLSEEQVEFLYEALKADGPHSDFNVYVTEYIGKKLHE